MIDKTLKAPITPNTNAHVNNGTAFSFCLYKICKSTSGILTGQYKTQLKVGTACLVFTVYAFLVFADIQHTLSQSCNLCMHFTKLLPFIDQRLVPIIAIVKQQRSVGV